MTEVMKPRVPTGALGVVGKATLLLAAGALGGLCVLKVADDRHVDEIWKGLERTPATGQVFSEAMVADLPEPARRYFLHAIRPGTPLATRVYLSQSGSLRIGSDWAPFTAEQVLVAGQGFVWKVQARIGGLAVTGTDHYAQGQGRMRIAAFGLVPIVNESGADLARSAIGRMVIEYMWLPSALLPQAGATVEPVDADRFAVTVTVDGETTRQILSVGQDGRLMGSSLPRYGNQTADKHYQYIPFGGQVDAEDTFGGYTIPTRIRAGWWHGTDQYEETFRFDIVAATYE
jgi:hypothetical protein